MSKNPRKLLLRNLSALRAAILVLFTLFVWSCAARDTATSTAGRSREASPSFNLTIEQKREILESAWTKIRDKHFDPTLGGVDWNAAKAKVAPKVDSAASTAQLAMALNEMTDALGHSHVQIMPPKSKSINKPSEPVVKNNSNNNSGANDSKVTSDIQKLDNISDNAANTAKTETETETGDEGSVGIRAALVEGTIIVTHVTPGSDAENQQVKTGDEIIIIYDNDVQDLIDVSKEHGGKRWQGMLPYMIHGVLSGPQGTRVPLTIKSKQSGVRSIMLRRGKPEIQPIDFGYLGSLGGEFESKILDGNILYIRFTPCAVQIQDRVEDALQNHNNAAGVILDLRGNPGGVGAVAMGVSRFFVKKEVDLGEMKMRGVSTVRFFVNPAENPYEGPLVILVDESTGSTAEILSAGLQTIGRARIVGMQTMGAALPSTVETLPYDWSLMTPIADFKLTNGKSVEGDGVIPDVQVSPRLQDYKNNEDTALAVALKELRNSPSMASVKFNKPKNEDVAAGDRPLAEADEETIKLMERVAAAYGGAALFGKLESMHAKSRMLTIGIEMNMEIFAKAPNKICIKTTSALVGDSISVYDGNEAWQNSKITGLRKLEGSELAEMKRDTRFDAAVAWRSLWKKVEILERKKDGDRDCIIVLNTPYDGEGFPQTTYLDASTYLPYRKFGKSESQMGLMESTTEIIEYKDFGGVLQPAKLKIKVAGSELELITDTVEWNVPVDDSLFAKPELKKKTKKPKATKDLMRTILKVG
ncbi:MAG: S41 family peptidase [Planctomycetota bacterium]